MPINCRGGGKLPYACSELAEVHYYCCCGSLAAAWRRLVGDCRGMTEDRIYIDLLTLNVRRQSTLLPWDDKFFFFHGSQQNCQDT